MPSVASALRPYGDSLCSAAAGVAASMAAKLAANTALFEQMLQMLSSNSLRPSSTHESHSTWRSALVMSLRLLCYAAMAALNGVMLAHLTRAMATHGTLRATTLNSTISFVLSGVLGAVLFGEELTARWSAGMAVGMAGLALFQTGQSQHGTALSKKLQ